MFSPRNQKSRRSGRRPIPWKRIAALSLALLLAFGGGVALEGSLGLCSPFGAQGYRKLAASYRALRDRWYFGGEVEGLPGRLTDQALAGMAQSELDSHTGYLPPALRSQSEQSLAGESVGIGVVYQQADSGFLVVQVVDGSPAAEAGILPGDLLVAVDGVPFSQLEDPAAEIAGEAGTAVRVSAVRGGVETEYTLERRKVDNSASGRVVDGVGVLTIRSFTSTLGARTGEVLTQLQEAGCTQLVIDLRGNGGGYVDAAVEVASYFLPEGAVVYKEENKAGKVWEITADQETERRSFEKIAVLVDGDTASASEILTAALKEQLGATVVGSTTYGKGTVQSTLLFGDGSGLKYTRYRWLTPGGGWVNGQGIEPDLEVSQSSALDTPAPQMAEGEAIAPDQVGEAAGPVQTYLAFLGYPVARQDSYYAPGSADAVRAFRADAGLPAGETIDSALCRALTQAVTLRWYTQQSEWDAPLRQAVEATQG
ncbi:S41 family peptidase [Bittarella massiliensis (ex Durand et al. 2017)]|uniref:S41 family peptidase n=1 Tax=Bittarella massiliensis (ex Durand et al. 2017) TaxID=1720313 RepID=UPI001AA1B299|nr:S41 family peptidase [Bittarella massiliensis (ex Durand et al. 2017)]MBO1678781.1 S41 family peptidase [Bittarella massiliensis (ex Durand et al. 2017)]